MGKSTKNKIDYYALTDAEKRVVIAQDVLARLGAGKIRAISGSYFEVEEGYSERDHNTLPAGDLREALRDRERRRKRCEVCALGAMFYSQVMLGNGVHLSVSRGGFSQQIKQKLKQVFDEMQMREIETAFEGDRYDDFGGSPEALAFFRRHADASEAQRLRFICLNIVRNDGTFVP